MKKGQITIEYLLILVVLIMLFTNVSMDLIQFTSKNTLQMQTKEIEKSHNQTLQHISQSISLQAPGAKQTMLLNTPPDCAYNMTTKNITLECREDTPSENYTGETIGKTTEKVQYLNPRTIPRGESAQITLYKTEGT